MWGQPPRLSRRAKRGAEETGLRPRFSPQQSTPDDLELSSQHTIDGFRISHMLLLQDPDSQRVFIIAIKHWHRLLHDDRPMIKFFVHKMHRAPGNFHPISEGLLLCFKSRKGGQE